MRAEQFIPGAVASAAAPKADRLLAIYVQDHFAAATMGLELARRLADRNRDDAEFGPPLATVRDEIAEDREILQALMRQLEIPPSRVKAVTSWLAEKAARTKLNGQITGYSPLSRMIELEGLSIGIAGKGRMWKVFTQQLGAVPGFDFAELAARADAQRAVVERLHLQAGAWLQAATART